MDCHWKLSLLWVAALIGQTQVRAMQQGSVQTKPSTTTHGGIVLKYQKLVNTASPPDAKCPPTMRGREICNDQVTSGTGYTDCTLYCQPRRCGYTRTFRMDYLGNTRCLDTMAYMNNGVWIFVYVSRNASARNVCTAEHTNFLTEDDYVSGRRPARLRAIIDQFSVSKFYYYIRTDTGSGYQKLYHESIPVAKRANLAAAILCYDTCKKIDPGSGVVAVDKNGYYSCGTTTKMPIVHHARAVCRNGVWYGDCIDRSGRLNQNINDMWSSGGYNCKSGLVSNHQNCIASPLWDGTFDVECITFKMFRQRHGPSATHVCWDVNYAAEL